MDLKLKNKVVVITACTGGIGQELVKAFAAEGCYLAVSSTSQEKLDAFIPTLNIAPDHIKTYVCDMTKEAEVQNFIDSAAAHYGRIDSLIVNQGSEGQRGLLDVASYENWLRVFHINVFGVMFAIKYASRYMKEQKHGSIVVTASAGSLTGSPGMSHYSASKHAVYGLVKSATLELAPYGVHCNCICPGAVETPMIHRLEKLQFAGVEDREERKKLFEAAIPDKRYCQPEEIANLALLLASDLSSHINGGGHRIDGGIDARD